MWWMIDNYSEKSEINVTGREREGRRQGEERGKVSKTVKGRKREVSQREREKERQDPGAEHTR